MLPARLDALLKSLAVVAVLVQAGLRTTLLMDRRIGWKASSDREAGRSTAVTLLSFGDYGLFGEVAFHVTRPDLDLFQDRLHQVNMEILGRARKEGLDLCPARAA